MAMAFQLLKALLALLVSLLVFISWSLVFDSSAQHWVLLALSFSVSFLLATNWFVRDAHMIYAAVMTWIGLVNNEPIIGYPHNEIVYICVSIGLGILGGFLFMFFYPIGLYFVGGRYCFIDMNATSYLILYIYSFGWFLSISVYHVMARKSCHSDRKHSTFD